MINAPEKKIFYLRLLKRWKRKLNTLALAQQICIVLFALSLFCLFIRYNAVCFCLKITLKLFSFHCLIGCLFTFFYTKELCSSFIGVLHREKMRTKKITHKLWLVILTDRSTIRIIVTGTGNDKCNDWNMLYFSEIFNNENLHIWRNEMEHWLLFWHGLLLIIFICSTIKCSIWTEFHV